jgi:putative transposase
MKRTVKQCSSYVPEKMGRLVGQEGRDVILLNQLGVRDFTVPMTKFCRWFDVPRRTVYYKPVKSKPTLQGRYATPINRDLEAEPSFHYRTVSSLLGFNKNTAWCGVATR